MNFGSTTPSALDYFATLVGSDQQFPLMEAAISVAQDEYPQLDLQAVLSEVDQLQSRLHRRWRGDQAGVDEPCVVHTLQVVGPRCRVDTSVGGGVEFHGHQVQLPVVDSPLGGHRVGEAANLAVLCGPCHALVHEGLLDLRGTAVADAVDKALAAQLEITKHRERVTTALTAVSVTVWRPQASRAVTVRESVVEQESAAVL